MKKLMIILAIAGIMTLIPLGIAMAQTTSQTTPSVPFQCGVGNMTEYCQGAGGTMGCGGGTSGSGMMGGGISRGGMMRGVSGWGRGMMGW